MIFKLVLLVSACAFASSESYLSTIKEKFPTLSDSDQLVSVVESAYYSSTKYIVFQSMKEATANLTAHFHHRLSCAAYKPNSIVQIKADVLVMKFLLAKIKLAEQYFSLVVEEYDALSD